MRPHPIAVDNYFVNRENTPLDEFGEKNYECLEAIDVEQFNKDMLALLSGERVELPVYNFKTGMREYRGDFLKLGERRRACDRRYPRAERQIKLWASDGKQV